MKGFVIKNADGSVKIDSNSKVLSANEIRPLNNTNCRSFTSYMWSVYGNETLPSASPSFSRVTGYRLSTPVPKDCLSLVSAADGVIFNVFEKTGLSGNNAYYNQNIVQNVVFGSDSASNKIRVAFLNWHVPNKRGYLNIKDERGTLIWSAADMPRAVRYLKTIYVNSPFPQTISINLRPEESGNVYVMGSAGGYDFMSLGDERMGDWSAIYIRLANGGRSITYWGVKGAYEWWDIDTFWSRGVYNGVFHLFYVPPI